MLRRLLPERAAIIATAISHHPIQSESVDYVGRAASCWPGCLCLHAVELWKAALWRRWVRAALLAKEECAAFPLFLAGSSGAW